MLNIIQNPPFVLAWVTGDASAAKDALSKFTWRSPIVVVKVVDSVLRGVAQVVFVNNPLSGSLILLGLFLSDFRCGSGALLCSLSAITVAKVMGIPNSIIEAGLTNFNAVLVGTVIPALYPVFFHQPLSLPVWGYMIVSSVFSVCVLGGLGRILDAHTLPAFTLPFNLVTSMAFVSMREAGYEIEPLNVNQTHEYPVDPTWNQVWLGTLLSAGQVWGVESVWCSTLVMVAVFISSPLLTLLTYTGATVATFTALVVSSAPYTLVEAGVWGYNGFLSAGAITFFMVPTPRTLLLAVINAFFTTFIHSSLSPIFASVQLPVLTIPFCLSSLIFLSLAMSVGPASLRVSSPSFPERHLVLYAQKLSNEKKTQEIATTVPEISRL
nr:urea transporter 2-like isoform X2 [Cherax quadricarinatus]